MKWKLTKSAKAKIPAWNAETIRIIESTDDFDIKDTLQPIKNLYAASGLDTNIRIIKVPSVFIGIAVNAAASFYWNKVDLSDSKSARSATASATELATRLATDSATDSATYSATDSATRLATRLATDSNNILTESLKVASLVVAQKLNLPHEAVYQSLLGNINVWTNYYNGGSEWASWSRYLSFVRDVCDFSCPEHLKFKPYEELTKFGPRFMHVKYVIMCDKAMFRHKNENNLIHNDKGPAIGWRCGTKQWYINGIKVTQQIVEFPEYITIDQINSEKNGDVQRIMLDLYGVIRYIEDTKAIPIDSRRCDIFNTMEQLYEICGSKKLLAVDPSGEGIVMMNVPDVSSCEEAQKWLNPFRSNVILST